MDLGGRGNRVECWGDEDVDLNSLLERWCIVFWWWGGVVEMGKVFGEGGVKWYEVGVRDIVDVWVLFWCDVILWVWRGFLRIECFVEDVLDEREGVIDEFDIFLIVWFFFCCDFRWMLFFIMMWFFVVL